jgi:hypothetical protein
MSGNMARLHVPARSSGLSHDFRFALDWWQWYCSPSDHACGDLDLFAERQKLQFVVESKTCEYRTDPRSSGEYCWRLRAHFSCYDDKEETTASAANTFAYLLSSSHGAACKAVSLTSQHAAAGEETVTERSG